VGESSLVARTAATHGTTLVGDGALHGAAAEAVLALFGARLR